MSVNITVKRISEEFGGLDIRDKPLMNSPYGIFTIYAVNILLNCFLIPHYMKNRKAVDFMKIIHFTDVLIILRSFYFIACTIYFAFWRLKSFNYWCLKLNTYDPFEAEACWQFLMSLIVFVLQNFACSLGKKEGSIPFYLIVHHTVYPIVAWFVLREYPGGHVVVFGVLNCISHVVISSYRLLLLVFQSSFMKKWEREIVNWTSQVEFLLVFVHSLQVLFLKDCPIPRAIIWTILIGVAITSFFHAIMLQWKPTKHKEAKKLPIIEC